MRNNPKTGTSPDQENKIVQSRDDIGDGTGMGYTSKWMRRENANK